MRRTQQCTYGGGKNNEGVDQDHRQVNAEIGIENRKLEFIHHESGFTEETFMNNNDDDAFNDENGDMDMDTYCHQKYCRQQEFQEELAAKTSTKSSINEMNENLFQSSDSQNNSQIMNAIKNGYEVLLSRLQKNDDITGFTEESQEINQKVGTDEVYVDGDKVENENDEDLGNGNDMIVDNNHHIKETSNEKEANADERVDHEDKGDHKLDLDVQKHSSNLDDQRKHGVMTDQISLLNSPNNDSKKKSLFQLPNQTTYQRIIYKDSSENEINSNKQSGVNVDMRNEHVTRREVHTIEQNKNNHATGDETVTTEKNNSRSGISINDLLSPVNVYDGVTQSLPTQMILTPPDNSINSNATTASTSSEMNCHSSANRMATSQNECRKLENYESPMDQIQSNLDSIYGASTEVIRTPSVSKSQDIDSVKSSDYQRINPNDSDEYKDVKKTNQDIKSVSQHGNNSMDQSLTTMNDDSSFNSDTLPLSSPTKSFQSCLRTSCLKSTSNNFGAKAMTSKSAVNRSVDRSSTNEIEKEKNVNDSLEMKTVIAGLPASLESVYNSNDNLDCENGPSKQNSLSHHSLFGPTSSQHEVALSYPNDYIEEQECAAKGKGKENLIDYSKEAKKSVTYGQHEKPLLQKEEVPLSKPSYPKSLCEKKKPATAVQVIIKKSNNHDVNDDIVDSDEESGRQDGNFNKGSIANYSFLPPSPGSRQERIDTHGEKMNKSKQILDVADEKSFDDHIQNDFGKCSTGDNQSNCEVGEIVKDISQYVRTEKYGKKDEAHEIVEKDAKSNPANAAVKKSSRSLNLPHPSKDNDVDGEMMLSLTDTQPEMEQNYTKRTKLHRIKRGVKSLFDVKSPQYQKAKKDVKNHVDCIQPELDDEILEGNTFEQIDDLDEAINARGKDSHPYSQTDSDIITTLQNLREINVNEIKEKLLKSPLLCMETAQKKLDVVCIENKKLKESNTFFMEENAQLKHRLSIMSARLKEKTRLCNEVKNELDQIQPLIQIVQKMGNSSETITTEVEGEKSEKRKLRKANNQHSSSKEKDDILEGDKTLKNSLFETPRPQHRGQRVEKSAVVSVSTNKRTKGIITFKVGKWGTFSISVSDSVAHHFQDSLEIIENSWVEIQAWT